MSPHSKTTLCQVCGEVRPEEPLVVCTRCSTLHHLDCWVFTGHCSTYGCGSTGAEGEETALRDRGLSPEALRQQLVAPREPGATHCGYCNREATGEERLVHCSSCGSPYHLDCWGPNDGCKRFDCRSKERLRQVAEGEGPRPGPPGSRGRMERFLRRQERIPFFEMFQSTPKLKQHLRLFLLLLVLIPSFFAFLYKHSREAARREATEALLQEVMEGLRSRPPPEVRPPLKLLQVSEEELSSVSPSGEPPDGEESTDG